MRTAALRLLTVRLRVRPVRPLDVITQHVLPELRARGGSAAAWQVGGQWPPSSLGITTSLQVPEPGFGAVGDMDMDVELLPQWYW